MKSTVKNSYRRHNLIKARKAKGYTQASFAKAIGLKLRQYQNYEYGVAEGTICIWEKIEKRLGCNMQYLRIRRKKLT